MGLYIWRADRIKRPALCRRSYCYHRSLQVHCAGNTVAELKVGMLSDGITTARIRLVQTTVRTSIR